MAKEFIFGIIGGLGLFIYGISLMSEGLHKASGERMKSFLSGITNNPVKGALLGAGITSIIQSSSATTVMVVGFVNASLMTLRQAIGVIFGANIGTTITAQLIAFKLTDYCLPIIGAGTLGLLVCQKKNQRHLSEFLLGFGILFLGLSIMTETITPLKDNQAFRDIFINFSRNPFLAVLAGTIVTAIIQSSSVTTGMILALASLHLVDLRGAIPLVLGCKIGTCITAAIASIGTNISARRSMLAHLLFNVSEVVIFLPLLGLLEKIALFTSSDPMRQVANVHTITSIANTIVFLPFTSLYARLLTHLLPGHEEEELEGHPKYLDKHLLATPPIALEAATREIVRTLGVTQRMMSHTMTGFMKNDLRSLSKVAKSEEAVDSLRCSITNYLVDLMQQDLTAQESVKIPALIHVINDVERIGDHAENLMRLTEQKIESRLMLTAPAVEELKSMHDEVSRMASAAVSALETNNIKEAERIIEQEAFVNSLRNRLKDNHVKRLEQKQCNVLSGVIFLDMISNYEKIGDHLTNVAQKITEDLQWNTPVA